MPSTANSHPQVSEWEKLQFVVVHNGIITNYRALKEFLSKQGVAFEVGTESKVLHLQSYALGTTFLCHYYVAHHTTHDTTWASY